MRTHDAASRTLSYQNDAYGQVLIREEQVGGVLGPRQLYYYFDGHRIGDVGNNGPSREDYARILARGDGASQPGRFRFGGPIGSADFDQNYEPIGPSYPGMAAGSYSVRDGDTLQSIALGAWGDGALWYLIAEANGLTSASALVAGQMLILPNKVTNFHNTNQTFRVYNPGEAIGDAMPVLPPEPAPPPPPQPGKGGCGGFGQVIKAVVAIAVAAIVAPWALGQAATAATATSAGASATGLTAFFGGATASGGGFAGVAAGFTAGAIAGAAGSIASQGVGVATGIQDEFNWSGVALSAIAGGVGGGLGAKFGAASNFGQAALRGATANVLTQGIAAATGLQHRFDWTGVAVAGVMGGVAPGKNGLLANTGRAILGAGVRTAFDNDLSFGEALQQAIPDAIGQTIGNAVAGSISSGGFGRGVGKTFAAVGDTLGFDGSFGYEGPDGRNLSLAGLSDSFESLFDGGGSDAELVFWTPPQDGLTGFLNDGVYRPGTDDASLLLIQGGGVRGGSRTGIGGNGPPPEYMTMREIFPGLQNAPAGAILAPIDSFLGLSAPGDAANLAATELAIDSLTAQIREISPNYHYDTLRPLGGVAAMSWEGRDREVSGLRVELAATKYNFRGETGPLQVETLRFLQGRVDAAYTEGTRLYEAGRLNTHLGRNEAIGNYIDGQVRQELRSFYNTNRISYGRGQDVTVNNRDYNTSGTDRTYTIPDARVGRVSFEWTLTPKTLATPQVRGFFNADSRPAAVIIVRPTQLGQNSTYLITRPAAQPGR